MIVIKVVTLIGLLSITMLTLNAKEVLPLKNLSLNEALKIMKSENLELKISKFNEKIKQQEALVAKGHIYGKLELELQALRSNDAGNIFGFKLKNREATFGDFGFAQFDSSGTTNPLPEPTDLNFPDARNHYQTTLTYTLPLYTGGKLSQYDKIPKSLVKVSQLETSKLLNEKKFQTTKTFYDISLLNQYIQNLNSIVSNIDELQAIVSSMKNEGFAKETDILEVQARKAEAQNMLSQAIYNKDLVYQYLSFLLNHKVIGIQNIETLATPPRFLQKKIYQNNLDVQKVELGLKITKMAIRLQEANFLPTVGAFGEYGSSDNTIFNEFRKKNFYTVGLQVQWNLFNGNIDKYNLEKSKIENMKVQDQVSLAKSGLSLKIKKLTTEIKSKDAEIKSLKIQYNFSNKVYKNYQGRYKEGISSISDVLIKQSKELEVLLKLLTAKNDHNAKVFELVSILNNGGK